MRKNTTIIITAVAAGCLIVELTAGYIAGRNNSRSVDESGMYTMETAEYDVGVSKEVHVEPDDSGEIQPTLPTSPTQDYSQSPNYTADTNHSENAFSGGYFSSGNQGSEIGVEIESSENGIAPESGGSEGYSENIQDKPEQRNITYYDYINMSADEKNDFAGQFSSGKEFSEWKNAAAEDYAKQEAEKTYSGSVNIDETFGNN